MSYVPQPGKKTQGRRVECDEEGWFKLQPGEYVKVDHDEPYFMARVPEECFHLGSLQGHEVVEHEDGTITVSPSILHTEPNVGQWHGFLERGVWREC